MKIIVTNNAIEYNSGFLKLGTLKEALNTIGSIKVLVYHKSNEKVEDKVEFLTKLKSRVKTLVYIRNKENCEQAVQMIVVGSGGRYFDDEFFLEDSTELNNLISNLSEMTQLAELGGVNVISDFFTRYVKEGDANFNSTYLSIVKKAVTDMIGDYNKKNLELVRLSETATELFSNSVDILSGVEEERSKLKFAVESLEKARDEGALFSSNSLSSPTSVYFFPKVNYPKERKILRIKEVGSFPYLTSFMMGYHFFLTKTKYVRAKLIFIYSVGDSYTTQYSNYPWINSENFKSLAIYHKDIVFTNYPNKDVLSRLLDDSEYDYFIVVDRMKQSANAHILNSKGSIKFAAASKGVLDAAGVKPPLSFTGNAAVGSMFVVSHIPNYPQNADQRRRVYLKEHLASYNLLYGLK